MGLDGMESFEIQHRLEVAVRGGIAIDGRDEIRPERLANRRLVLERVRIGLADQLAGNVRPIEPVRDAVDDRRLERIVMEDRGVNEGRKLRLVPGDVLGFAADALPNRVDGVELAAGRMLSHAGASCRWRGFYAQEG